MCWEAKQKRLGNSFAESWEAFDHQLRTEGYPVATLHREGQRLLAPGITVKKYMDTLIGLESVEEVDGIIRYCRTREDEIAAIIYDEFLKGESAQWYRAAARRILDSWQ